MTAWPRVLTREDVAILNYAMHRSVNIIINDEGISLGDDLQDGVLAHYKEQAHASDANIEARLDKEPFDFKSQMSSYPANNRPTRV